MDKANLSDIYFWKRYRKTYNYPWQRYLNQDFLETEKKRISDVLKWRDDYLKKKINEDLNEVTYYVIPTIFNASKKVSAVLKGKFSIVQLSALKNSDQLSILMLLPFEKKVPKDNSLIKITKSKKDYLTDKLTGMVEYAITVEEYEYVDPLSIYPDAPNEKNRVSKFFKENLFDEEDVANAFQAPISSSPNDGKKRGISLAYNLPKEEDIGLREELLNRIKLMHPPEMIDVNTFYPETLTKGKEIICTRFSDVKSYFSEKTVFGNNYSAIFQSPDLKYLDDENKKRNSYKGEYSIASDTSTSRGENTQDLIKNLLAKFYRTEAITDFKLDDFWDKSLENTKKEINEELWMQIANQRNNQVTLPNEEVNRKYRSLFARQSDVIIDTLNLGTIAHERHKYAETAFENGLKVAQSIARDLGKKEVDEFCLDKAYKLFIRNSEKLMNKNETLIELSRIKSKETKEWEDKRHVAIRSETNIHPCYLSDLFEAIGYLFDNDMIKLEEYLQKLKECGRIYEPKQNFYQWVE